MKKEWWTMASSVMSASLLIFWVGFWAGRGYTLAEVRQKERDARIKQNADEILESLKKINKDFKDERAFIQSLTSDEVAPNY